MCISGMDGSISINLCLVREFRILVTGVFFYIKFGLFLTFIYLKAKPILFHIHQSRKVKVLFTAEVVI